MSIHSFPSLQSTPRYCVYALLCQDGDGPGYIKFGMSGNIGSRLSSLRMACPIPVRYIATYAVGHSREKARSVEKALHIAFGARQIKNRGEWFRFDFSDPEDKKFFNDTCRLVFRSHFGENHDWWSKVSVDALDKAERLRRAQLVHSKAGRKIISFGKHRTRQRRAWKELG